MAGFLSKWLREEREPNTRRVGVRLLIILGRRIQTWGTLSSSSSSKRCCFYRLVSYIKLTSRERSNPACLHLCECIFINMQIRLQQANA